jgi:hypothetical protein
VKQVGHCRRGLQGNFKRVGVGFRARVSTTDDILVSEELTTIKLSVRRLLTFELDVARVGIGVGLWGSVYFCFDSGIDLEVLFIIPARDASRSVDGLGKWIGYSMPDGPVC